MVSADVSFELANPGFAVAMTADLVACPANATSCSDVTVSEIVDAVLSGGSTSNVAGRILRRFKAASVDCLSLNFDSVSAVTFNLMTMNQVMRSLNDTILRLYMTQFNAKYDTSSSVDNVKPFLQVLQMLLKWYLNNYIKTKLKPRFESTCYDQ